MTSTWARPRTLPARADTPASASSRRTSADPGRATAALRELYGDRDGPPDIIWHLAANSDISAGVADRPSIDFTRTLGTTFAVLQAAKAVGARAVAFASTSGSVYRRERRDR